MKNHNAFLFTYFAFGLLLFCSCGTKPPPDFNTDGGLRIVLQPDIEDIMRTIQASEYDEVFNNALIVAQKTSGSSSDNFLDKFIAEIKKNDSTHSLSSHFLLPQNKSVGDVMCVKFIKEKIRESIDKIKKILAERINKYGVEKPIIQNLNGGEKILIELPGVKASDRIRKLLQASANVEFWETYEMEEIGEGFVAANEHLAQLLGKETSEPVEEKKLLDTSSLAAKLSEIKEQNEDSIAQNPLFSIFYPAYGYDEKGLMKYDKSCIVGTAKITDTAQVNRYLSLPEIMLHFPKYIKFLWMFKPASHIDSGMLQMVAIRTNRKGLTSVTGAHITSASVTFLDEQASPSISILMNKEGAFAWKSLSGKNIGRSIAIVVDNQVYSCPLVNAEIPSGNTSLEGDFTMGEATDFANVLNAGKLPVMLRIVSEEEVPPMNSNIP